MKEIVKLGYEDLQYYTVYYAFIKYYNTHTVETMIDYREDVKEIIKKESSYYYLKDALLSEPINQKDIIYAVDAIQLPYKIVTIPQQELEFLLVKNKLGGYLTVNIIQDKEFDKIFYDLYQRLL